MSDISNDDIPGFVAEKPENCFACYRLIHPGHTYHPTIGHAIFCEGGLDSVAAVRGGGVSQRQ